jgi:hypothetical protein
MKWKGLGYWLLVPLSVCSLLVLTWRAWPQPRATVYQLYRSRERERTLEQVASYERKSSERFELYYTAADAAVTDLVLKTAESVYDAVVEEVGFQPEGRVPLILYPTRQEMRQAFGWGNGESALGVYWQGTIRLLSPNVWITQKDPEKQAKSFRRLNPIAHELTHYVLDYLTNGNYPRWFTEGLAQWVEHQVTGYLWIESSSTLKQPLYSLEDLRDRFDSLKNQPLAYRQSYLLLEYMVQTEGEESLGRLIQYLAQGISFDRAVEEVYGKDMVEMYTGWKDWVAAHLNQLEQER